MVDRKYNIVQTRIRNNRVDFSYEIYSDISITEAEKRIMDFAEDAIQYVKDPLFQTITITKHNVTIESKDYGETTTNIYAVVKAH